MKRYFREKHRLEKEKHWLLNKSSNDSNVWWWLERRHAEWIWAFDVCFGDRHKDYLNTRNRFGKGFVRVCMAMNNFALPNGIISFQTDTGLIQIVVLATSFQRWQGWKMSIWNRRFLRLFLKAMLLAIWWPKKDLEIMIILYTRRQFWFDLKKAFLDLIRVLDYFRSTLLLSQLLKTDMITTFLHFYINQVYIYIWSISTMVIIFRLSPSPKIVLMNTLWYRKAIVKRLGFM